MSYSMFMDFLKKTILGILLMPVIIGSLNFVSSHSSFVENSLLRLQNALPENNVLVAAQKNSSVEKQTAEAVEAFNKVSPSVVTVFGVEKLKKPVKVTAKQDDKFYARLDSWQSTTIEKVSVQTSVTTGMGFFVTSDGYIMTNKHVVYNKSASYSVVLSDGRELPASVEYLDSDNDLAILKVSGDDFVPVSLGDSTKLKKGQKVLNIGNSYSRADSEVSSGTIASLKKTVYANDPSNDREEKLTNVLQVNTQLYPGDSGGPLIDMSGALVGVNVAAARNVDNMGFAIPVNTAKNTLKEVGFDIR